MLWTSSAPVTADPMDYLWHAAQGEMVFWLNGDDGPVGWVRTSHRGVQWLDKIHVPKSQRRYVFSEEFEVKYNHAFEEVVRACADLKREGKTFLTEEAIQAYVALHRMGFAYSYEAWKDGRLAGGGFGIQLGSMLTAESQFYRVSNASKAAYGQTLIRMRERGFRLMDVNVVARHSGNYGEEWLPQWEFEQVLRGCLKESPSLSDDFPATPLPRRVRYGLPVARAMRAVGRRFGAKAAQ